MSAPILKTGASQMGRALTWSNLLSEPLVTLYGFLGFILYKDLGASPFEVTLLVMLKPVVTVLSFYWSAGLKDGKRLKSNVMWAGFWMRAPFLLCPWVDSIWFVIAAAVNYMFFYRAAIPAWLEMLRRNVPPGERGRAFSLSSALGYLEGVILSLAMGFMLDADPGLWKILFFGAALLGMTTVWVQSFLETDVEDSKREKLPLKELLIRPWRDSFHLIREKGDFRRFQWGFMLSGFGIMLIQPALPMFAVDNLSISYLEMAAAVSIAKGLGFALSSPLWAKWIDRAHVLKMARYVFLIMAFFPALLSLSSFGLGWFFLAYFLYGIGQGGSHLVWNMSGPIFAGKEGSSHYTGVNVVLAGLRGCVAPLLGGYLMALWGPIQVLVLGGLFSFYSGLTTYRKKAIEEKVSA